MENQKCPLIFLLSVIENVGDLGLLAEKSNMCVVRFIDGLHNHHR